MVLPKWTFFRVLAHCAIPLSYFLSRIDMLRNPTLPKVNFKSVKIYFLVFVSKITFFKEEKKLLV